jgi:hypothetical protein
MRLLSILRVRDGEAILVEDRKLCHRQVPVPDGVAPGGRDGAQRQPDQFRGRLIVRKWPRVLMIFRSRACTLSRALVTGMISRVSVVPAIAVGGWCDHPGQGHRGRLSRGQAVRRTMSRELE